MEYLHETEINALLKVAFEHNREHHLALLLMYATGTRVSQALKMRRAKRVCAAKHLPRR
jgi:site-specific recombinase XerD